MKTAFCFGKPDRYNAQLVMRYARPFVSQRRHGGERPENSVDGKKRTQCTYRFRAGSRVFSPREVKKKKENERAGRDPIRISSRDPLKLSACSLLASPSFSSLRAPPATPPRAPAGKDARRDISTYNAHHPLRHIRSINSRSEPLGATNKTVKPFN